MQESISEEDFAHLGLTKGYNYSFQIKDGSITRTFRATYDKVLFEGPENRITSIYLDDCTGCSAIPGVVDLRNGTYQIPIRLLNTGPDAISHPIKKYDTDLDSDIILKGGRKSKRNKNFKKVRNKVRKSIRNKKVKKSVRNKKVKKSIRKRY
jgi:hypothetical protein